MYAIVKYTDNTMENYEVVYTNDNLKVIDNKLHEIRRQYYNGKEKPLYRIIKM